MNKNAFLRCLFTAVIFLTTATLIGLITAVSPSVAFGQITLTPIGTPFNNPIGIDHHEPTNQVVMSVNYFGGTPHNFELVAADGTRTQFSSVSGLTDEVKIATVRSGSCQGGFTPGELFTGTGVAGEIARISPDGLTTQIPWVTLPNETGLMRGSLFQDKFCSFGGDLIVVTTAGNVWRVTSSGSPTLLKSLGTHLEGVTTVPNDTAKYGPWSGKILAGAEELGCIYAIDATGAAVCHKLGINPEDFDIIPANENFFGVDFGGATLWGAPASAFTSMVGDILIAQEFPGILWHVRWNGSSFDATNIAQVAQWEHVTFSKAGIVEIPPAEICGNGIDDDKDGFIDEADSDCQVCGDGNLDPGEQCDDGNIVNGDGCSSTCQLENQPPVAKCKDVTVTTDPNSCSAATASVNDGSFDPDKDTITLSQSPAGPYGLGPTPVTLTVTDTKNASDFCTATVTVVDQTPPAISCPAPQTIECTSPAGASATVGSPTATDNCTVASASCSPSSGTFPIGATPVSCSATDGSGNTASCGSSVTVVDTTKPTVSCVESVNPSGKNVPKASNTNQDGFYKVSGSDICSTPTIKIGSYVLAGGETIKITQTPGKSGVSLVNTMGPLAIKHFQVGPGDATITATDGSGNSLSVTCLVPPPPK